MLQQAEMARLKRENTRLEEEVALLKKAAVPLETAQVKYAMIKTNETHFPVGMMCLLPSVSRSGYYAWKRRPPSVREQSNRLLKIEIKRVFDNEKGRPNAPRVARRLQDKVGCIWRSCLNFIPDGSLAGQSPSA